MFIFFSDAHFRVTDSDDMQTEGREKDMNDDMYTQETYTEDGGKERGKDDVQDCDQGDGAYKYYSLSDPHHLCPFFA